MAETKEKRYVSDNAQLMAEWNWEMNADVSPYQTTLGSGKKAWWRCDVKHEWQATINNRNNGTGCPYCLNQKVLIGYNDLQTVNPSLAAEWNFEKNSRLTPFNIAPNISKKVWWKCAKGHEWQTSVSHRSTGRGCPYCSGKKAWEGYNDLLTNNPAVALEWNYKRNGVLKPENLTSGSGKKVWWKCKKEHEWQARISDRIRGRGCPICNSERSTSFPEYAILYYLINQGVNTMHSYREFGYELDIYIPSKHLAIEYDGYYWHKNKSKEDLDKNIRCKKDGIKLYRIREGLPSLNDYSIDYIVQKNQNNLSWMLSEFFLEILGIRLDIDIKRDAIAIENLREYTEKEHSILNINLNVAIEWDYEKNGNLKPENVAANSRKKFGGNVDKGMNGCQLLTTEIKVMDVHIAPEGMLLKELMIYKLLIRRWLRNGILRKTKDLRPKMCHQIAIKKYGGSVIRGTNGKLLSITEHMDTDVHFVRENMFLKGKTIYKQLTPHYRWNGISKRMKD